MKLISWNVNGIRACLQKGFEDAFRTLNADFFCLQETKAQPHQVELDLPGYRQYWYSAEKKGYSGTAIFARYEPLAVTYGVGVEELDHEGRLITLEYPNCFIATCYTPNAQDGLKRLDHRMAWDDAFRAYPTPDRPDSGRSRKFPDKWARPQRTRAGGRTPENSQCASPRSSPARGSGSSTTNTRP